MPFEDHGCKNETNRLKLRTTSHSRALDRAAAHGNAGASRSTRTFPGAEKGGIFLSGSKSTHNVTSYKNFLIIALNSKNPQPLFVRILRK